MAAIFAAGALCVVFTRGIYQAAASLPREAALLTLVLGGLALLVLCICGALVFQSVRKEEPVERSWLVYPLLVAAGLLFSLLLPPLSGPDEPSHYATAATPMCSWAAVPCWRNRSGRASAMCFTIRTTVGATGI